MIDLNILKNEWNALATENATLKERNRELTRLLLTRNVVSNQEKLARSYRIGYLGFAFPLLGYLLYITLNCAIRLSVVCGIYGIVLGSYDLWFINFVKRADYTVLSTVEALNHAIKVVRYQNWATVLSLMLGICVVVPLFEELFLLGEDAAVIGGIWGGIIGGIIGLRICIRNQKLARRMVRELKNIEE